VASQPIIYKQYAVFESLGWAVTTERPKMAGVFVFRVHFKPGCEKLVRVDYHGAHEVPKGTCGAILKAAGIKAKNGD
jgi:predicted RNA binding protein YcfA (HicA-like mRNA interferase family)